MATPDTAYDTPRERWEELYHDLKQKKPDEFDLSMLFETAERKWAPTLEMNLLKLDVLVVRKLLSVEQNPPIDEAIQSGCVVPLIDIMNTTADDELAFEAAWAVTNVASGSNDHTDHCVSNGAVEAFAHLFKTSANADVFEQACWGLGNIAGDSARLRDMVLAQDVVTVADARWDYWVDHGKMAMMRNFCWMVSNLCRSKPQPPVERLTPLLPLLGKAILHSDEDIMVDGMWGCSYFCDGPAHRAEVLCEAIKELPVVIKKCLRSSTTALLTPTVRIIGNMATGSDQMTQQVMDWGFLEEFDMLLAHPKRSIRKEACWTLSNIAAGTPQQVRSATTPKLLRGLFSCLGAPEYEVKKEAVWTLANATCGGGVDTVDYLMEHNILRVIASDILPLYDAKIILVGLELLENVLAAYTFGCRNPIAEQISDEQPELLDLLENLQNHTNNEVYTAALNILETYFEIEDEE